MFLSKNQNGRYYIIYKDKDNKRAAISTGERTKKEAQKFFVKFQREQEIKNSQLVEPIRLKEFQFHFFRYAEPIFTAKTMRNYKTTFNFLKSAFGNPFLTELTSKELETYLLNRLKSSSVYSASRDYRQIASMLNKAVQDGFLLENPMKKIKRFRLPEKQPLFYSKEDFQKLIEVIDNPDIIDIVKIALYTGLRQGELIQMDWSQVDFNERLLILNNQNYLTKSKRIRTVPLTEPALEILAKRQRQSESSFVFTLFNEKIKQDYITHKFKKYVRKAKINSKLTFHSLRHTTASWLVQSGVSIYHVSKILGHADIKTTMIYCHVRTEDLRNSISIIQI